MQVTEATSSISCIRMTTAEHRALLDNHNAVIPDQVIIFGSGRWAKVYARTLIAMLPSTVKVVFYSQGNAAGITGWLDSQTGSENCVATSSLEELVPFGTTVVIVANKMRSHIPTVQWAMDHHLPVLVEKPFCDDATLAGILLSQKDVQKHIYPSHIFLFASYLEKFKLLLDDASFTPDMIRVEWRDNNNLERHGDVQTYDPDVPVYVDVLPHIVPILTFLTGETLFDFNSIEIQRGGAAVDIQFQLGAACRCNISIERNAQSRTRLFELHSGQAIYALDFSTEPGIIIMDGSSHTADPEWAEVKKPLQAMLEQFLCCVGGEPRDHRLDMQTVLNGLQLIEKIRPMYAEQVSEWIKSRAGNEMDESMEYALAEMSSS